MILGAWCEQPGLGGWVLMAFFWAAFVGLVLWALGQLFGPVRGNEALQEDADDLDQRWAQEQMDLCENRTLHDELTASTRARDGRKR